MTINRGWLADDGGTPEEDYTITDGSGELKAQNFHKY